MQNAEYVNQLTQDCRSVVAVIVDTIGRHQLFQFLILTNGSAQKLFIPNISALEISKSAPKCRRVEGWVKLNKRKTDHKSKCGVIPDQYIQASRRVILISCREQQAQT